MTTSTRARPVDGKMSWRKGKTSGWTAFDRAQRHKEDGKLEAKTENFPSVSDSGGQISNILGSTSIRIGVLEKPFASVLHGHTNNLGSENHYDMDERTLQAGIPLKSEYVSGQCVAGVMTAGDMLKKHHPWADQSLIDDVLTGVKNDVARASTLLNMMVTSENNCVDISVTVSEELKSKCIESHTYGENKSSVDKSTDLSKLNSLMNGLQVDVKEFQNDEKISSKEIYIHDDLHCEDRTNFIPYVAIEPEWEEDDVYIVHRKDALRMMRSASHHSKAARDAYLRGDHVSAQLHSRKACEEWIITQRLNGKAAMEILAIRNSKNDEWTLDLHGLHASEAVQALGAHLQKIESHIPVKRILYTSRVNVVPDYLLSVPPESASFSSSDKLSYPNPFIGSRPTSLQVITGKGTHSRGEASIPAAIKRFLTENGYRYDESWPGVIDVKPKFRRPTKD